MRVYSVHEAAMQLPQLECDGVNEYDGALAYGPRPDRESEEGRRVCECVHSVRECE